MNDNQTPYERYKLLLGYLSSYDTSNLADETIEAMQLRITELELATKTLCGQGDTLRKIFKIVSGFNGGRTPVGCDGMIMLKVDEYNALVQAINEGEA